MHSALHTSPRRTRVRPQGARQLRVVHGVGPQADVARPRILVVDDDLDARVILEGFLEASGYLVSVAKDGREALALIAGGIPTDVLVLDLMMPHMNGQQLLAALRTGRPEWRALPVLVVTAAPEQVPEAAAVFAKPASLDALLAAIDRLLGPRAPTDRTQTGG